MAEGRTMNILPTNEATCLSLPAVQEATTKIVPTKCLDIAEPRIFWYIQSLAGHTPQTDSSKYIQLVLTFGLLKK